MSGILLIVSGPSGVGKSTVCRALAKRLDAFLSVSVTTRPRRGQEVDGREYWFISQDDFEGRIARDEVLEYARVYGGHYYGTPAGPVLETLEADRVAILEIEIEGTVQVKKRMPEAIGVYLQAPSDDEQRERLVGRREDSEQAVRERLAKADAEIRRARECGAYDYYVVNRTVDETVEDLVRIVDEARTKRGRRPGR